ncbi:ribosomal protein S17 [Heterostelium album PN500]|uniref:Ribosomal protein S17 n=1 Tax=Heterostelium pallidum (strain ATCC 26659 / Pp 5 / PN500) TaxID=670386 RepID=D3B5R5_HETP5|nr:ribosomal protein S17 [Heterostelium album PN500]EFA83213.1 ribosomal protein S17 [Heterostelium album PN500]|eukprot:XP_020435330.1 ribosomal protein S17 [Heterostelium album PN500]
MISKIMDILGRSQKILRGTVISKTHTKTAMIEVVKVFFDRSKYASVTKQKTKYMIHDPSDECIVGDYVNFTPCKPVSKRKSHVLVKIAKRPQTTEFILKNPQYTVTAKEIKEQKEKDKIKYTFISDLQ